MTIAEFLGERMAQLRAMQSGLWLMEARLKRAKCHSSVLFLGRPMLSCFTGSEMILSEGVRVNSALRSNPAGCFQPSVLRTLTSSARVELGKNVGISATVILAGAEITIGEGTIIGVGAFLLDNDYHVPMGEWGWANENLKGARPIRIGRGTFIGGRSIILKGVTIGDRAMIGAGSVVTKDVPDGMIAAGNPARILGPFMKQTGPID